MPRTKPRQTRKRREFQKRRIEARRRLRELRERLSSAGAPAPRPQGG